MSAWSYSLLTSFETCPRRHAVIKIYKKVVEPQSIEIKHGNELHKALEQYGKGVAALPAKYEAHKPMVDAVLTAKGQKEFEVKFALTVNLEPTRYFADDCWVRGVLDLKVVNGDKAVVVDWKTGKPKNDAGQLRLFAAAAMALHPQVSAVRTGYAWLAHGLLDREDFNRGQFTEMWDGFRTRVERLENALKYEEFPPKPSGLCANWCPVPKKLCEFSGKA